MRLVQILQTGLLAVLFLLGACSQPVSESIRFGIASAPVNFDPRFATDASSERINRLIYQRLVTFNEQSRPVPSLASWTVVSPTQYRFHLRDDESVFHNGTPITATDVAATYRSILNPDTGSPHRGTLKIIERVTVIDADTVDFHLHKPDVLFPGYLGIGILPEAGIKQDHSFSNQPLGSGPFRFRSNHNEILELVRRHDGVSMIFEQVRDPAMRVLKLLRGEIDILQNDLPAELIQYLTDQSDITLHYASGSNFSYIGFQMEDVDTSKLDVRRAIALSIDRNEMIRYVFRGAARPASSLLPPEHWAGWRSSSTLEPDLVVAKGLLRKAGYGVDHPLEIIYKTSNDPFRVRIATIIQQQLSRVGIKVDVKSYDWGTFYGDIKEGRFQMYSLAWVGVKSPDIFRYAFHSESLPPDGANRGRLSDPEIDRLIETAMLESDLSAQIKQYIDLQVRLFEQLPYIPLWYEGQFYAARKNISGYRLAADGNYDALSDVEKVVTIQPE